MQKIKSDEVLKSDDPKQIIAWAQIRGTRVLVVCPGTDGTYIEVNKKDFISNMSLQINALHNVTKIDCVYSYEPIWKSLFVEGQ